MKQIGRTLALLVAAFAGGAALAGPTTTTYNYYAKASVRTTGAGSGSVYISSSSGATSGVTDIGDQNSSFKVNASTGGGSVSAYFYAIPAADSTFEGWSKTSGNTDLGKGGTNGQLQQNLTTSTTSDGTQDNGTWYALFKKIEAFGVTFEAATDGNSYTVNGGVPQDQTGLTTAYAYTLASDSDSFYAWDINGTKYYDNPYSGSAAAATTVKAVFLTADEVATVTTADDLTAKLADTVIKKVTIPEGTDLTIASATVPSGKMLVVSGVLRVTGTLANSGSIVGGGTIAKLWKSVTQSSEVHVVTAPKVEEVYNTETINKVVNSDGEPIFEEKCKYRVTSVANGSGTVSGANPGCNVKSYVAVANGAGDVFKYYVDPSTCKGLKCSVNTKEAVNHVSGVDSEITGISSDAGSGKMYLLLANIDVPTSFNYNNEGKEWNMCSTVDCAGSKLTGPNIQTKSRFDSTLLNGKFSIYNGGWSPQEAFNCKFNFINCNDIYLGAVKSASNCSRFRLYDCGPKVAWSYESSTTGSGTPFLFFTGTYTTDTHAFDAHTLVIGGSFSRDPNPDPDNNSTYLIDKANFYAPKEGSYYVVKQKPKAVDVVKIERGGQAVKYTSLGDAVANAASGETIDLIDNVTLAEKLVVDSGKALTLNLNGLQLLGEGIENNGTLYITDADTTYEGKVAGAIVNNGVMDITFGTYAGGIENAASGTLTVHNGKISKSFVNNGTVTLKGGHFPCDVSDLVAAEGFYVRVASSSEYIVCERPSSTMYEATVSSYAGYGIHPYSDADFALIKGCTADSKINRSDYSTYAKWQRVAELKAFVEAYGSRALDATAQFDRDVEANTMVMHGYAGITKNETIDKKVLKDEYFRGLTHVLLKSGEATVSMRYQELFTKNVNEVEASLHDKSTDHDNYGTACKIMIELWEIVQADDYHEGNYGHMATNSIKILASERYVIGAGSNVAMKRPDVGAATFKATLAQAIADFDSGSTIMLCNDCAESAIAVNKATTFALDTNGFAFSGTISAGDGYELKGKYTIGGKTQYVFAEKATPDPQADGDDPMSVDEPATPTPSVTVTEEWVQENVGDNVTPEEVVEKLQSKDETTDNGLRVWENVVLEQAGVKTTTNETAAAVATVTERPAEADASKPSQVEVRITTSDKVKSVGVAKVSTSAAGVKTIVESVVKAEAPAAGGEATLSVDYATLGTGVYQPTVVVESNGTEVEIPDPTAKPVQVVKNVQQKTTTMLTVPFVKTIDGQAVTVASVVDTSTLSDNDMIKVYNKDTKMFDLWYYEKQAGGWSAADTSSPGGSTTAKPASDIPLTPGQVVILERSNESASNSVSLVGLQIDTNAVDAVELPIDKPAQVAASEGEKVWSMVGNIDPEKDFDLNRIENANAGDTLVVPVENAVVPREYRLKSLGSGQTAWTYSTNRITTVIKNGRTFKVAEPVEVTGDARVRGGEWFWYVSGGGDLDTKIDWKKPAQETK